MGLKFFIKNNLIFLLPILSGILLILAYPPYDLGFLVWVALIPLFWFLILKQASPKKALIGGTVCGILFFGKLFSWFFATAPFEWLGITAKKDIILVFGLVSLIWLVQTIFLGLFIGVFAWITKKIILLNKASFVYLLIIPALWVLLEYLRAWGFGIFWLGKETLFGPHWTFGNLAYTLHNKTNLIQIADIGGIYLISFLIVLVNVGLFLILKQCERLNLSHIAVLLIILGLVGTAWVGYGTYKLKLESHEVKPREAPREARIALLQTNFLAGTEFNSYQRKEIFETLLNLLRSPEAIQYDSDIIIIPEGFGIVSMAGDKEIAKYLLKDFWRPGQVFIENQKTTDENGKAKSRTFYYDLEKEEPLAFHDKMLLVPGGDFLPYSVKLILNIYSFNLKHEQRLSKRGQKVEAAQTQKGNIGGTICSSILSPNLHRQMTQTGAEFLAVVSSDAPFHGSEALLSQNLAMLKLRAVENRRYVAQATNMGYSFLLNPKGEITVKSSQLGNEILLGSIFLLNKKTIYTKFGDWLIILSTVILLLLTFILWYNRKSP